MEYKGETLIDILITLKDKLSEAKDNYSRAYLNGQIELIESMIGFSGEVWSPVKNTDNKYYVSNKGNVISNTCNITTLLAYKTSNRGYHQISTLKPFGSTLVHRLVAQAFIPNPDNKAMINHKNGIKTDNRVENLEWATHSENVVHAIENGLMADNTRETYLNEVDVAQMLALSIRTDIPYVTIAKMYGTTKKRLYKIRRGEAWAAVDTRDYVKYKLGGKSDPNKYFEGRRKNYVGLKI